MSDPTYDRAATARRIADISAQAAASFIADARGDTSLSPATSAARLRDAAEVLATLADDLERAAAHEGIATAARGEFSAVRTCVIADNIADLRSRSGHLRFLARTAFGQTQG